MIPKADIVAWRQFTRWVTDAQAEQDLIISRVLVAIFQNFFWRTDWSSGVVWLLINNQDLMPSSRLQSLVLCDNGLSERRQETKGCKCLIVF